MSSMQRLELRQGQSLVMTPQLLQSIKLLQLSHAELAAYVEAELERNPLLQEAEGRVKAPRLNPAAPAPSSEAPTLRMVPRSAPTPSGSGSDSSARAVAASTGELGADLEATLARAVSLAEHLETQLDLATADPQQRAVGRHLIHSLNEAGYLTENLDDIADTLHVAADEVMAALRLIQSFDPAGIGARNLAECLSLQLKERDRLDPAMEILVSRLDLVAKRDFVTLTRLCGVDDEDLAEMLAEIRRLEPKPGLAFTPARVEVLIPDVLVRPSPEGGFIVELNPDTLPRILLDRSYYSRVVQSVRSDKEKDFLSECLQSASWLTRSLDQRAQTILKVATEIVRHQEDFFREGVAALRPLTLKDVAEKIGMHESTVSRVVANKAIGTARGSFAMKFFFNVALGDAGHSAQAVRYRIKQLIAGEAAKGIVLSDDAIAQKLKADGIEIARRTVAKYREILQIPSSAQRRRTAETKAHAL
ncbi:RNA polymerase factor sigma-54 [Microvirga terricola]|uniref:RNA polymerase sigma-54 factor n=1 Tax=Microvirga terricola TaxID=2719797 RepID=A0ABX0V8Q9_9HYPH|nr:RNA polymerase factor sigma-54 [Microvirga terricola]NIX75626.1 RNA polymerase factor sigma-54 [Microvirga terricola]